MSISVEGLGAHVSPADLMAQLLRDFNGKREARLQRLLEMGVRREEISVVTRADCEKCRGAGRVMDTEARAGSYVVTLSECPDCPGICVNGKPIVTTHPS